MNSLLTYITDSLLTCIVVVYIVAVRDCISGKYFFIRGIGMEIRRNRYSAEVLKNT